MRTLHLIVFFLLASCGKNQQIKHSTSINKNSNNSLKEIPLNRNEESLKKHLLSKRFFTLNEIVFLFSNFPNLNSETFKKLDSYLVLNCYPHTQICEINYKKD